MSDKLQVYNDLKEYKKFVFRGENDIQDKIFVRGEGIYLYDELDNQYIDCAAGTFNLSLGCSNKAVLDTIINQSKKLIHLSSSYMNENVLLLAKKLVEVSPNNITRVHTKVCGGSTANEGAIKLAQYYTGKKEVLSFFRSHVGQTIFTQSLSGLSIRKRNFKFSQDGMAHFNYPYCYRCPLKLEYPECNILCIDQIYDYINYGSDGNISCIIIEPILGNGGNQIPPKEYFTKLKKLCDENGIVLIFDEIQTGVGRTGKMFAADHLDIKPNIITIAKGLGGIGTQIAAILMEEKFNIMDGYLHSFTYGSNILSCSAALTTLNIISDEQFLNNVTLCGDYILKELKLMKEKYEFIGDVRGLGLMIGIEIVKNKKEKTPDIELTKYIRDLAFENHLMLRTSLYGFGNVIKIRPALSITLEECNVIMNVFREVLDKVQLKYYQ